MQMEYELWIITASLLGPASELRFRSSLPR